LWGHAAVLALVLAAFLPFIGSSGQFSADEGAAIAQARQLERGDGWTVPDSFPQADPDGSAFPYELSTRGGDRYATFAKHPVYPVLLAAADRVLGNVGMLLLSIGGTVAAATISALLARRLDPRLAVPALWVTGIASPLFFDSYTVIAHTIGAALTGVAVMCAVRAIERPRRMWSWLIVVAIAAGTVLRTEMLLFALGLSIALVVAGRARAMSWLSVAPVMGAAAGSLLDRVLLRIAVPGPQSTTAWLEQPSGGFIGDRLRALKITWLLPAYDVGLTSALLVGAIVSGAISIWLARARPSERDGVRVFAFVSGAAAVAWLLLDGDLVPGLLSALPIVVIGAVAWDRRSLPPPSGLLIVTFAVFSLAVLATQYASGGSGEWGGRYFAIGIPVLVPVVLLPTVRIWRTLDRPTAMLAISSFVVVSLALTATAAVTLRRYRHDVDVLVSAIDTTTRARPTLDGGAPVVITTNGSAARFAYTVVEHTRWLTVTKDRLAEYRDRLRALGVESITFVTTDKDDLRVLQDVYRDDGETHPVPGWIVASLRLR
jgi:hypothetical protein